MTQPVWTVASVDTAARWAATIRTAGYDALALPWSEIVSLEVPDEIRHALESVGPDLVLLTSPNALRALSEGVGAGFDAACVGEATAQAARAAGFTVRRVGRSTGEDLARVGVEGIDDGCASIGSGSRHDDIRDCTMTDMKPIEVANGNDRFLQGAIQ